MRTRSSNALLFKLPLKTRIKFGPWDGMWHVTVWQRSRNVASLKGIVACRTWPEALAVLGIPTPEGWQR